MPQLQRMWCSNCGTEWAVACHAPLQQAEATTCPACYLPLLASVVGSVRDLEEQLDTLMTNARTGGLDAHAIVHVLHIALQYALEMDHIGHAITVELIDLGPDAYAIHNRPVHDRREMVQTQRVQA